MYPIDLGKERGRLVIGPRPQQPSDILGYDIVVCLLTDEEIIELGLQWLSALRLPVVDRGVPPNKILLSQMAENLAKRIKQGESVLIHCRAGIGRSALLAGAVMVHLGWGNTTTIFEQISRSRGVAVPDTQEQVDWLAGYQAALVAPKTLEEAFRLLE